MAGNVKARHLRLIGPLVRTDVLHAEVKALFQIGRLADVERLPADGIEAALQPGGVAVHVAAPLDLVGQREEAMRRIEHRVTRAEVDAVAADGEEAGAAQCMVDGDGMLRARPPARSIRGSGTRRPRAPSGQHLQGLDELRRVGLLQIHLAGSSSFIDTSKA